ncbi:alpha/beta hydrolase [Sphingomonas parva]|uniref:Alpha/beta hydrolase n=1 Tax=Sphingomonas parva TaxID=2555898 RepID=A0A4Y8ZVA7_9SPHN|nr:alpha/beta hydrolase [Sphingomonas parva]TFI59951.1 alpha/beta hydrolase [Sphingomonas parva]
MRGDVPWRRALLAAILLAVTAPACESSEAGRSGAAQPEIVRIWRGAAPGSETWTGDEVELDAELPVSGKVHIVTNVSNPTLTVFRPEGPAASRTAVVVLPGGAFRALAWDMDGLEVGRWLAARGVTAFVLKYRVRPPGDEAPTGPESFDAFLARTEPARRLAVADAVQALRLVRADTAKYGIAPDRVGMIGFSAGAIVTMDAALAPDPATRPDFAVSVYGAMPAAQAPAAGAPPVFVVAAQDDPQVPSRKSVEIYQAWTRAGLPAELHLYEKGGHGFGMRPRGLAADKWPLALEAWLQARGLLGGRSSGR